MALAMAREAWTDERLDDLNERVASIDRRMEAGFAEMRGEFRAVRGEMREEFRAVRGEMEGEFHVLRGEMREEIRALRGEMREEFHALCGETRGEFRAVRGEMQAMHRTTMVVMFSGFVTMLVGFGGTIATILLT
jgi:hypothetical protein